MGLCFLGVFTKHQGLLLASGSRARTARDFLGVDACLEAGGAPVHEADLVAVPDLLNGGVDDFGHDVAAVEQAASHQLACFRVALGHLIVRLKHLHRHVLPEIPAPAPPSGSK